MVFSIVNHKGGTGKTTTALNLGVALAGHGLRVCLVDFDAQGSLTYSCGKDESGAGIAECLTGEATVHDAIRPFENVSIIPGGRALADIELSIAQSEERFTHLKNVLVQLIGYDVIIIDCPPSLSLLTLNALFASDHVIIPMQMDVLALRGLDSMLQTIHEVRAYHPEIEVAGVLPVMADGRKRLYTEIGTHILQHYDVNIFATPIRTSIKAMEAPSFGSSVIRYAPSSTTASDYRTLATELISILQEKKQTV